MKIRIKGIVSSFLALCIAFSGLQFIAGGLDVFGASKVSTKITLKATAYGQTKAKLRWNRIKDPKRGYAVFRDGKPIAQRAIRPE